MQLPSDMELAREYAVHGSEPAFEELVNRHIDLVYSTALRHVRNPHLAEEITQATFIILARKAGSLRPHTVLTGWLFKTARYVASAELRTLARRQRRELEAHMESVPESAEPLEWEQIAPLLDEAIAQLGEADRNALMLRFFKQKPLKEVGQELGMDAAAAQMRVTRAVEKLRKFFLQRGLDTSATTVAESISAYSVQAAPATLAKSVAALAIAKGATASTSTLTLIKGALKIMAWTKAKTAIVAGIGVILVATTTIVTRREINIHSKRPAPHAAFSAFASSPFLDRSKYLSPFTSVHFDAHNANQVTVAYAGAEYQLAAIDGLSVTDILDFCRRQYGRPPWGEVWAEKRFAEDLVVALSEMGHPVNPDDTVSLTLIDPQTGRQQVIAHAAMTEANRRAIIADRSVVNSNIVEALDSPRRQ